MRVRSKRIQRTLTFVSGFSVLGRSTLLFVACLRGAFLFGEGSLTPPSSVPSPQMVTLSQLDPGNYFPVAGDPDLASAPYVITEPGLYKLSTAVSSGGPGATVQIKSPWVTLDLNGQSISQSDLSFPAIEIDSEVVDAGVVIRNGSITGRFSWGVLVSEFNGRRARMVRLEDLIFRPSPKGVDGGENALHNAAQLGPKSRIERCRLESGVAKQFGVFPGLQSGSRGFAMGNHCYVRDVSIAGGAFSTSGVCYVEGITSEGWFPLELPGPDGPQIDFSQAQFFCNVRSIVRDIHLEVGHPGRVVLVGRGSRVSGVTIDRAFNAVPDITGGGDLTAFSVVDKLNFDFPGIYSLDPPIRVFDSHLVGNVSSISGEGRGGYFSGLTVDGTSPLLSFATALTLAPASMLFDSTVTARLFAVGPSGSDNLAYPIRSFRLVNNHLSGGSLGLLTLPSGSVVLDSTFENSSFGIRLSRGNLIEGNRFIGTGTAFITDDETEGNFVFSNYFQNTNITDVSSARLSSTPNFTGKYFSLPPATNAGQDFPTAANFGANVTVGF